MLSAKTFLNMPPSEVTAAMEEEFFTSIMGPNGTYKTTYPQRFREINDDLVKHILITKSTDIKLLDIGISSGINTVELYDDLKKHDININIIATDILINARLIKIFPKCHVLVNKDNFPLRFDIAGGTLKPWVTRQDMRNGFFFVRKLVHNAFMHRLRQLDDRNAVNNNATPIKLVTPRLLNNADITVTNDDITCYNAAYSGRFDFIRAANILNKSYFDRETLLRIINHIVDYLSGKDSLLFVARTHGDRTNHGTLFRIGAKRRFDVVWRVGNGSEVEDMVLNHT